MEEKEHKGEQSSNAESMETEDHNDDMKAESPVNHAAASDAEDDSVLKTIFPSSNAVPSVVTVPSLHWRMPSWPLP